MPLEWEQAIVAFLTTLFQSMNWTGVVIIMALESANTGSPMAMSKSYGAMGKDIAALAAFCDGIAPA